MVSSKGATSMPWRFIDEPVVFDVLADLEDRRVLQQRLQRGQRLAERNLVFGSAAAEQVAGAGACGRAAHRRRGPGADGQREADELGLHRIERGGLGVEGDDAGLARLGDPGRRASAGRGCRHRRWWSILAPAAASRAQRRQARTAVSPALAASAVTAAGAAPASCAAVACRASAAAGAPAPDIGTVRVGGALDRRPATRLDRRPASVPVASATRRVSVVNSIAFRKPISFGPSGGCSTKSSSAVGRPARRSSASPARARCAPCRHWR